MFHFLSTKSELDAQINEFETISKSLDAYYSLHRYGLSLLNPPHLKPRNLVSLSSSFSSNHRISILSRLPLAEFPAL